MMISKRNSVAAVLSLSLLGAASVAYRASGVEPGGNRSPRISPEQFGKLRELIKPKPGGYCIVR